LTATDKFLLFDCALTFLSGFSFCHFPLQSLHFTSMFQVLALSLSLAEEKEEEAEHFQ